MKSIFEYCNTDEFYIRQEKAKIDVEERNSLYEFLSQNGYIEPLFVNYCKKLNISTNTALAEDIKQNAMIGLLTSLKNYDKKNASNASFNTYAYIRINGEMSDGYRELGTISIPSDLLSKKRKIDDFIANYLQEYSEPPSVDTISYSLNIDKKTINDVISIRNANCLSADNSYENEDSILETNGTEEDIQETKTNIDNDSYLEKLKSCPGINEREKDILINKSGIISKPISSKELAKKYNISENRINQIYKKAFDKFQQLLTKK